MHAARPERDHSAPGKSRQRDSDLRRCEPLCQVELNLFRREDTDELAMPWLLERHLGPRRDPAFAAHLQLCPDKQLASVIAHEQRCIDGDVDSWKDHGHVAALKMRRIGSPTVASVPMASNCSVRYTRSTPGGRCRQVRPRPRLTHCRCLSRLKISSQLRCAFRLRCQSSHCVGKMVMPQNDVGLLAGVPARPVPGRSGP